MNDVLAIIGAVASILALAITLWILRRKSRRPTWKDALSRARDVLEDIQQSKGGIPSVIIGIGRSGGIWGGWLAENLGSKPFLVVDVSYEQNSTGRKVHFPGGKQVLSALEEFKQYGDSILLVEGAASTGQTFTDFFDMFPNLQDSWKIQKAVLYKNPTAAIDIEYVGKVLEPWPSKFPWHERDAWRRLLRNGSNNEPWL